MNKKRTHFKLTADDFEHLIRGGELIIGNNHLILADIGYRVMNEKIIDASVCESLMNVVKVVD